jgi:hypothetical protein
MKSVFGRMLTLFAAVAAAATLALAQEPPSSPPPAPKPAAHKPGPGPAEGQFRALEQLNQSVPDIVRAGQATSQLAIVMVFGFPVLIVAVVAWGRYRRTRLLHETLRLMVEKGVTIPPELLVPAKPPATDFRRGVLFVSLGLGLCVMLGFHGTRGAWSIGLVPLILGAGYLLVARLAPKPPTSSGPNLPS